MTWSDGPAEAAPRDALPTVTELPGPVALALKVDGEVTSGIRHVAAVPNGPGRAAAARTLS